MPGSKTAPGRPGARNGAPVRVAFRQRNGVGAQDEVDFTAQWLAYAYFVLSDKNASFSFFTPQVLHFTRRIGKSRWTSLSPQAKSRTRRQRVS